MLGRDNRKCALKVIKKIYSLGCEVYVVGEAVVIWPHPVPQKLYEAAVHYRTEIRQLLDEEYVALLTEVRHV